MSSHSSHDTDNPIHITPVSHYLLAGGALFVLTLLTVGVAYVDFGPLNDVIALVIAMIKAGIIVVIFMHGRHTQGMTRIAMVAGLLWFFLLVAGVMDDYLTRGWIPFLD